MILKKKKSALTIGAVASSGKEIKQPTIPLPRVENTDIFKERPLEIPFSILGIIARWIVKCWVQWIKKTTNRFWMAKKTAHFECTH